MNVQKKQKGFTIIEVVLVLAIAGLIFSMVFIALPALQRSQRDTQRKNDLTRAMTAINNYTSNNRGALPTNFSTFEANYLAVSGDTFIDPSGINADQNATSDTHYAFSPSTAQSLTGSFSNKAGSATQNIIYYTAGSVCDPGNSSAVTTEGGGSRKIALRIYLEGGGVYCLNN